MSKHTPGPWEIKAHSDPCYRYISAPKHIALAQVVWRVEEEDRSPACEANAHLIAAAPDLLEALEELVDLFGGLVSGEYPPDGFTTQPARDAIAKAKGEGNE